LTDAIPLEGIKGRFDHFGYGRGRVFAAASRSNAVVVVSVGARTLEHTISGIPDPQGVVYVPEINKLFVASGSAGKVYVYDGASYSLITTVHFSGGADNLRYDSAAKRVYVGCGDDAKSGAIAAIDAATNKRLDEEYKLGGEPQSFQLEKSGPNIYVNVPDLKQIVAINRATKAIARWRLSGVESNFPMALDEADHRLFVGTHQPARLAVFDTATAMICISTVIESESTCRDRKALSMRFR
jgi:DNA-binding beta-propeller fold protein YncE